MIKSLTAVALTLAFINIATGIALAGPFYMGTAAGQASADLSNGNPDENDFGYRVFAGWQFNRYLAAEFNYIDQTEIGSAANPGWESVELTGFDIGLLVSYPLTDSFSAHARLGTLAWDADFNTNIGGTIHTINDDGIDLSYGLGFKYRLSQTIDLRLECHRSSPDFGDLRLLTMGAAYSF